MRKARDGAVYTREQKGHSLILNLLVVGPLTLWITTVYYSVSPNHFWQRLMGESGNPANRAAARAAGRGTVDRVLSQLVVVDDTNDPGVSRSDLVAGAVLAGLGSLIEKGGAPLERSAITIGTDHPDHPGKIVVEVKTDRHAPKVSMPKIVTLAELKDAPLPDKAP